MADNFSGALSTWKEINLSELQQTLDAQGIELVDQQKESVVGRRALADKTKEFKKIPDDEKAGSFKGLLKAYQTEIDALTKRAKFAENAFLNAYKVLSDAPDPYPLLEAAVDQTVKISEAQDLEASLQRLREENTELKKRVADFAALEAAKKKAESKLEETESKMEELIREKVAQKESELHATYDERLRNYDEREQGLQRQVELAKNQLRDLRSSNDSNQAKLLNHTQRQDQEVVAKLAEMDMLVADLERSNSRVATVERRNELLRAEIEAMKGDAETSTRSKELENQIAQLEGECDRLSQALEAQKSSGLDAELTSQRKSDELQKELSAKTAEIEQLRLKVKQRSDYDELKRELDIMKFVEFSGLDDDMDGLDGPGAGLNGDISHEDLQLPNPNPDKANARQGMSLEALLATKNKRIMEELTKIRILHSDLEASLKLAEEKAATAAANLEKQRLLNEKLETDLFSLNKQQDEGADAPASQSSADLLAGMNLGKKSADSPLRSTPVPFTSSADTSILPIVTSQRDRFRQRNAELEEELRKQFQVISDLRNEIKSLQSDNLKLYEKVRYMQSYREEASGSRPITSQLDPLPTPARDDIAKYQTRYEQAINPFEAFRGREASRAYHDLNPAERGVLIITRQILGNRRARLFFIVYTLVLHVLVLFTTYECSTSSPPLQRQPPL